jgi:tetratricopeptide (TPR) repeat protein
VFAGGATLPAAQEVCGTSLATLEALEAKSLLRHREQPDGTTRLVMLETLRRFALEDGADRPDLTELRRRHCVWCLRLVERCVAKLHTLDEPQALDALDRDVDNIRGALAWALAADPDQAIKLAGLLGDYWSIHNDPDGLAWLDAALTGAGETAPARDRGRVHLKRARQLEMRWQWEAAIDAATSALDLYRESRDDAGVAAAYGALSVHRLRLGQHTQARAHADAACSYAEAAGDEALLGASLTTLASVLPHHERLAVRERAARLLTQVGDYRAIARLYSNAGWIALVRNSPEEAIDLLHVALAAADKLRTPAATKMIPLSNMGLAQLLVGNPRSAQNAFVEALNLATSEAFRWGGAESLTGMAAVLVIDGQLEPAAKLLGAASAAGYPGPDPDDQDMLHRLERDYFNAARASLGPAAWSQVTDAGAGLSFEQAIALALDEVAHIERAATATVELTG